MIRYSDEDGFIKSKGVHLNDESIKLPKVAIGVFSQYLYQDIIEKFSSYEAGYLACANYHSNVYIIKYKEKEITFFMAPVSAPRIVAAMEDLNVRGVDTFIIFGNCGVLDKTIPDCSIIIPTMGFREEGTSFHYVKESETIPMNPKYQEEFMEILKEKGFDYTKGYTWTTDAPYRETREKINYYKDLGCVCVEMEGTAIAEVCQRLNLNYFTFYYAGDNLDSVEWDERSLFGLSKLDKKKEVTILALDLAAKINSKC